MHSEQIYKLLADGYFQLGMDQRLGAEFVPSCLWFVQTWDNSLFPFKLADQLCYIVLFSCGGMYSEMG